MSATATALAAFLAPLLPGWRLQFGRWNDMLGAKTDRFCVIRPAGGPASDLVRRPQFTASLIGVDGGDIVATSAAADALITAMRASSGDLVFLDPAEPVFVPTSDGRPVFEIAISAITT